MLLDLVAYFTVRGRPAPLRTMRGHTESVWAVAFFKDDRRVVTGSRDCTLRISDVLKGTLIDGPFEGHKGWVNSVAVSPDDRRIASAGDDNTIIIWDVESKQKVLGRLVKHTGSVYSVSFSPDGTRLASGSRDTTVVVWDAKTGTVLATLRGHHNWVLSVAFSPDGLKLASASRDHTIRVWHTDNADFLFKINAHEDWVKSVVWSPDSHQLVSASFDKTIRFWDSSKGDQIGQVCVGHTHHIHSLAISSDGDFIATASDDKTVRLWSTKSHQQIGHALEHTAGAESVAISPNGGLLAIGGSDGKVRVWSNKNILEQQKVKERPIIKRLLTANPPSTPHIDEPARSDIQLFSHDTDSETCGDHESTHNHFSEVHETVCSHEKHDILVINTMVRNACIAGDLHTAEELLTQEINADNTNYNSYANRSVVRARNSQWDYALQDAVESIAIQPSLMGFISKGIALCGKEMIWHAMEAFNLAFIFSKNDPATTTLLRLIKAIALFNANHYDEAMREVQDVAMACQDLDTLPCSVVDSYLRVQHGIISFKGLILTQDIV
ncbi:WD40-repeat-containing domain protein [Suillus lakei]|nr:WD40-repeat-containing domain protein [Suillus lakei]